MTYLITAFLTFIITIILTPYLISFLEKKDFLDKPNGEIRRLHTLPVPRMGGILIFAVIIVITFSFYRDLYSKKYFLSGLLIVFLLGLWDDFKGVKWQIKFIVQSVAAFLLILSLTNHNLTDIKIVNYTIPFGLNYLILFVLIVGLINSFNLMDGLDGLVAGYSLIIASMCFLLSFNKPFFFTLYLSAAIIGTTLGFLKFNANPARIFLGDSGSFVLGYLISGVVIAISGGSSFTSLKETTSTSNQIDIAFVFIALAVPIVDTLRVMIVRLKNRKNIFHADNSHLHHQLYNKNIRHKTVVFIIHLFSATFALIGIFYLIDSKMTAVAAYLVLLIIFLFVDKILSLIAKKENLLFYGKLLKKAPDILLEIYKIVLLPITLLLLVVILAFLIVNEIPSNHSLHIFFFLVILISSTVLSIYNFRKNKYYMEMLVFVNLIIFFLITGLNGFFYKLYPVPWIHQVNINQIFIGIFSFMIIVFVLFKERIANFLQQFLVGRDLIIAVLIMFIYLAVQFINLPDSYKISDTLLRSYLLYLFYKIIIVTKPRFHFSLYYASFIIAILAVLKSIL